MRTLLLIIFLVFSCFNCFSQEVRVSEGINMRNDYAYGIIGEIKENILLYRDKGYNQNIVCYNASLKQLWDKVIQFNDDKVQVHGLVSKDTSFLIFNSYKDDGIEYLALNEYDEKANNIDSTIIAKLEKGINNKFFRFELSENEKYSLLYHYAGKNILSVFVINNALKKLAWYGEYDFEDLNLIRDLEKTSIDNNGEVFMLFEKNKTRFSRGEIIIDLVCLLKDGESVLKCHWENEEKYFKDLDFFIDNKNKKIGLFGLFNSKSGSGSQGFFSDLINKQEIRGKRRFNFKNFNADLFVDNKKRRKKSKTIEDLEIKDVMWRQDGGAVVFFEVHRELTRRNGYVSPRVRSSYMNGGWRDYYFEDVVILALAPDGGVQWENVLYKKQFSQDDEGDYSSFFIFETPSRLRLIFNDEIRTSSTVSEYIINGIGEYKRESLFSTEYENLRILFKEAIQISSNALLAPSERNNEFKIVKISY